MKIALSASLTIALLQAQTPAPQEALPTFRTGVDVVEIDVTVLDKDRRPVKGLTADDFTILDRGKPQPIVAFSAVEVPPPASYPASWMRDAPIDVVANVENRRLVAIVMDDAYTEFNPDFAKRAKQIAKNAVDELGPADLAAVIFTYMGQRQNFTSDRTRILAAIDSYVPKLTASAGAPLTCSAALMRSCDIEALSTAASTLSTATPGRKIAIVIGGGRSFSFGGPGNTNNEGPELGKLFRELTAANITVYAFDVRGLPVGGGFSAENRRPPQVVSPSGENDSLHTFAESTGGRAVTNTNDPESHVRETLRESSSYYFIGFRSGTESNDKRLRRIEVKVNRPGVDVHTRSGYYARDKAAETGEVINGLPSGDLPVHATAAAVAVPGRQQAEVVVATRVDPPGATSAARIELSTVAIDLDGKSHGILRQTITVTPNPASATAPDLPAHLPLPPGRYVIQVSATADGHAGAAAIDIDVPNFERDSLSASGLMLHRRTAPPIADKAVADLVPFLPTTVRQFQKNDEVSVFARIYEGGKGRIVPVRMTAKVTSDQNKVTSTQEEMLESENFSAARSADYHVTLPLAHLTPGEYLLEVDAQSGARHVRRTARFSVVN
jgi:VWFA-related protein